MYVDNCVREKAKSLAPNLPLPISTSNLLLSLTSRT